MNVSARLRPVERDYLAAFAAERCREYPVVDELERRLGFALDREWLESAAFSLACPVKRNPPNWQHGRVIYAVAMQYLVHRVRNTPPVQLLDVGTAKGFSALVMERARVESGAPGRVTSLDVVDPAERTYRNSIAEVDGPKTLAELLDRWLVARKIEFVMSSSIDWLHGINERLHVVFLDGKHRYDVVVTELKLIAHRQVSGDVVILDDVHIDGVREEWQVKSTVRRMCRCQYTMLVERKV